MPNNPSPSTDDTGEFDLTGTFLKKVLMVIVIALFTTLLVLFVGRAVETLLVIFAGVLLGIIFRAARDLLHRKLRIQRSLSLALVVILFLGATVGTGTWLVPKMYNEGSRFYNQLPETWDSTKQVISRFGWDRGGPRHDQGNSGLPFLDGHGDCRHGACCTDRHLHCRRA